LSIFYHIYIYISTLSETQILPCFLQSPIHSHIRIFEYVEIKKRVSRKQGRKRKRKKEKREKEKRKEEKEKKQKKGIGEKKSPIP